MSVLNEFPPGAVTPASLFLVARGRATLAALTVFYRDTGLAYVQVHDTIGTPTTATLKGGAGREVNATDTVELDIDWGIHPRLFKEGITIALSSTQYTYTASPKLMIIDPQWGHT